MMKSSDLVSYLEGKVHESSKERDGGCGSSLSSHGAAVEGMTLHPFHLIVIRPLDLGNFRA